MGIFNDLGFLNQDGVLTSPDCQAIDGLTAQNILDNAYNAVTFTPDSDGQIVLSNVYPAANAADFFNDGSNIATYLLDGNANDALGNYNATATNVTYSTGKFGQGVVFDGTTTRVITTSDIPNAKSVSFWLNVDSNKTSSSNFMPIGRITTGTRSRISFGGGDSSIDNETFVIYNSNTGNFTYLTSNISAGWRHFVISWNSSIMNWDIYIDGIKQTVSFLGSYSTQPMINLMMGKREYNDPSGFIGQWDQVRIFNRALTAAEVTKLYNEGNLQTVTQAATQNDWRKYQVKAVNLNGTINVNGTTQTFLSTTKNKADFFGDNSNVATYLFDGNVNDSRGNYTATGYNVTFSTGKFGQCAVFNGSNSRVLTNYKLPNTGDFSVSGWFKLNALQAYTDLFSQYDPTSTTRFVIQTTTGSGNKVGFFHPTAGQIFGTKVISANTLYHIVLVKNSGVLKIYIDNTLDLTYSTALPITQTTYLGFGSSGTTGDFMNGQLDNFRIFNRALTAAEVTKLYEEDTTTFTVVDDRTRQLSISVQGTVDKVTIDTWVK